MGYYFTVNIEIISFHAVVPAHLYFCHCRVHKMLYWEIPSSRVVSTMEYPLGEAQKVASFCLCQEVFLARWH